MDRNIILKKQLMNYLYVIQKAYHYRDVKQKYAPREPVKVLELYKANKEKYFFEMITEPVRYHLEINAPKREKKLAKILVNEKFEKIKELVSENYWIQEVSAISEFIYYTHEDVIAIFFSITKIGFTIIYGVSRQGDLIEPGIYFTSIHDVIYFEQRTDYILDNILPEEINEEENSVEITYHDILFWFCKKSPTLSEIRDEGSKRNFILNEDNKRFIKKKALNLRGQLPLINSIHKTWILNDFVF